MHDHAASIPAWFAKEWIRCGVRCSRWAGVNVLQAGAGDRRRNMQHFTLYAFMEGAAILRHGSETVLAEAGRCWLLPPEWTFRIRNPGAHRCAWLEVQLELLLDRSIDRHPLYGLRLPAGTANPPDLDEHVAFFRARPREGERGPGDDLVTRPRVAALMAHYLGAGFAEGSLRPHAPHPAWLEAVLAEISDRPFDERTTIASVAGAVGMAVSTVQHGLRRHLGRSFSRLQKERRISEARHLLDSNRRFTVATVAARCGYRSLNLFYRHYREIVGHPPRGKGAR